MTTDLALSPADARAITDQIKVGVEAVWHLITQAYTSRAWAILGYVSWDDYCTREFGTSRIRLPREDRQEVVASLRESGLSIRAIASATGIGDKTVQRDLASGVVNDYTSDPKPITGTDGKTYTPPPPTFVCVSCEERRPLDEHTEVPEGRLCNDCIEEYDAPPELAEPLEDNRFINADDLDELNQPKPDALTNIPIPKPQVHRRINKQASKAVTDISEAVDRLEECLEDPRFYKSRELIVSENLYRLRQIQESIDNAILKLS